jgi:hypothetical protein
VNAHKGGDIVKGIKELATVIASTGIVAVLLTAFFDWRARLLRSFTKEELS